MEGTMKDKTYFIDEYRVRCFPPKPQGKARWTWSCVLDDQNIYFVENTRVWASGIGQKELEGRILSKIGFEGSLTNRKYFFPGSKPSLEVMDRLHRLLNPPGNDGEAQGIGAVRV
ncbi:MAG: hypothetical protein ACKKL4_01565 [Patescibacteria group bacterium]